MIDRFLSLTLIPENLRQTETCPLDSHQPSFHVVIVSIVESLGDQREAAVQVTVHLRS
jgi:hypothetical protein